MYENEDNSMLRKNDQEFEAFLNENRKKINERFQIVLWLSILAGPMVAVMVYFGAFLDASYGVAAVISVFLTGLTILHRRMLKRFPTSMWTSMIALVGIEVLLLIMNKGHLTIYITWFLIPLLSLLFCDIKLYFFALAMNYIFMVIGQLMVAGWYAERRMDVDTAMEYFASRLGGLTIEMAVMAVVGFVLCRMITSYYRNMLNRTAELSKSRDELRRLNGELTSIADIYVSAFDIDLAEDTILEIQISDSQLSGLLGNHHEEARKVFAGVVMRLIAPESIEDMLEFIRLDTLEERLSENKTITREFLSANNLWARGRFIDSGRDEDGHLKHVIWLVENIDAEKRRRDELIDLSERMMAASEAKSAFLSNMSHEIRTPINAVLGMNEMILRESTEDNVVAYAQSVSIAGHSLLGIVNDILDFSKIEAGKMEIIPVDYDISSVINDLVNMVQIRADEKGLSLYLFFDADMPKLLHGDEVRVKQIITNILTNAVKYTEKGSVTFSITYERLPEEPDSVALLVSVKDTGIGIKNEDRDKLFSEFERLDEEVNRHIEGTGLGMSITLRLLSMMGSTLELDSVYGVGSDFHFRLKQKVVKWEPLGDYEAAFKALVQDRNRHHYKEKFTAPSAKVLVIDDNPMNLMVFKSLLKKTCVMIDMAEDGDTGISMAFDTKYDIIFIDHMMPGKDGIETLQALKKEKKHPNQETPNVCLTANAISGAREEYIAAGFDDYLSKPIDADKLENMLLHYLPEEKIVHMESETDAPEDGDASEIRAAEGGAVKAGQSANKEAGRGSLRKAIPEEFLPLEESGLFDVESGFKNSGGEESYLPLLKVFYDSLDSRYEELDRLFKAEDFANYTIKVHALKSSAKIIGAGEYGEDAQLLENAGKSGDLTYIRGHHGGFLKKLTEFREPIGQVLSAMKEDQPKEEKELPMVDSATLEVFYEELKDAADSMDIDRLEEIFEEMEAYSMPEEEKDLWGRLKEACDGLDYEGLSSLLEAK